MITHACAFCDVVIEGADLDAYGYAGLAHVREIHPDVAFPDMAVRNYLEGAARMRGSGDRLDAIGVVEVHPVTEDRIDDWLTFFDYDAMVGVPENSACYCLEPHELAPGEPQPEYEHWTKRRETMIDLLGRGVAFGYLAYVDGKPAGWVNASKRADCSLFRRADEDDSTTVSVSCFAIAPPYRRHGLSQRLLERVVADAASRGATHVEAYPINVERDAGTNFRGAKLMYDGAGFDEVKVRTHDTVVRRPT